MLMDNIKNLYKIDQGYVVNVSHGIGIAVYFQDTDYPAIQSYLIEHPEALVPEPVPPPPTPEQIKASRIAEIKAQLSALDSKSIRPIREGETARVAEIVAEIMALRIELAGLI